MNRGFVIWITGLPGSGKTTIANLLLEKLRETGTGAAHLESDSLRKILTPSPNYSREEREWFYSVLRFLGKLLSDNGVNVLLDATANLKEHRDEMRAVVPWFLEIYVRCPLQICAERDPKGIYAAANEGKASSVPGMQEPYEEPEHPELVLDSDRISAEDAAQRIKDHLQSIGWIS